jgi:hypothetical protein
MMDLVWFTLGILSAGAVYFLYELSQRHRLNWIAWGGLVIGIFLVLFSIAWAVGSVLEGVPRAASMGLLCFGLSGVVLLTFAARHVTALKSDERSNREGDRLP